MASDTAQDIEWVYVRKTETPDAILTAMKAETFRHQEAVNKIRERCSHPRIMYWSSMATHGSCHYCGKLMENPDMANKW